MCEVLSNFTSVIVDDHRAKNTENKNDVEFKSTKRKRKLGEQKQLSGAELMIMSLIGVLWTSVQQ